MKKSKTCIAVLLGLMMAFNLILTGCADFMKLMFGSGGGSTSSGSSSSSQERNWTVDLSYYDPDRDMVTMIRYTGVKASSRSEAERIARDTWYDRDAKPNWQYRDATAY